MPWTLIEIVKRPVRALAFLLDDQSLSRRDALINNGPVGWAGVNAVVPEEKGRKMGLSFRFLGVGGGHCGHCPLEMTMSHKPFSEGEGRVQFSQLMRQAGVSLKLVKGFTCVLTTLSSLM